jgi:nucleoside-specific outer membrane channel protein Tsx
MRKPSALIAVALVLFVGILEAGAEESAGPQGQPPKRFFYTYTMLQMHAFPGYDPYDTGIVRLMFERIGTGRFGDDYFFLGVTSYNQENYSSKVGVLYFKYAPCLSIDKVIGAKVVPVNFIGDFFLTGQVNSGDLPYLQTVWLYGIAWDIAHLPNYGRCRFYALVRKEETNATTHQYTIMWAQPFNTGRIRWIFNGWAAHWDNDTTDDVMKFEPQLRIALSSFLAESNFLRNVHIGGELEISHHYQVDPKTHEVCGWTVNPSVFCAVPF